MIKKIFAFSLLFSQAPCLYAAQQQEQNEQPNNSEDSPSQESNPKAEMLKQYNAMLSPDSDGSFVLSSTGIMYYTGTNSPSAAKQSFLRSIGVDPQYGTSGVDPFKPYTKDESRATALHEHFLDNNYSAKWKLQEDQKALGSGLIKEAVETFGVDVFKKIIEKNERRQQRAETLKYYTQEFIPQLVKSLVKPKVGILVFSAVILTLAIPIFFWHASKNFAQYIFARRPKILGDNDTDIYTSWWKRWRYRAPELPKVIVNDELDSRLEEIIASNLRVLEKNKKAKKEGRKPTASYSHILAYGKRGVGKTLFAKSLAQKTKMHFIYLTVADLSQLPEETALETLKKFFAYAKYHGPCILIVDEADILFGGDIKSKKLALLFQREFSKAIDSKVQLFFITNYPERFPEPILNRLGEQIKFDLPNHETKIKLFEEHLTIMLGEDRNIEQYKEAIDNESLLDGIVGRDIEAIASKFSLSEKKTNKNLKKIIKQKKKDIETLKKFSEREKKKEDKGSSVKV